jgi:hypothetical protein
VVSCWTKGVVTRPTEGGRIRLAIGETERISLKGGGREILLDMKGWRPSACQRLDPGSGAQAGAFLPDVGSIGLSFSPSSVPGLMTRLMTRGLVRGCWGSLFALMRLRGRQGRTEMRAGRPRDKTTPALHLLNGSGETGHEDRRTDDQTSRVNTRRLFCRSVWSPESTSIRKNGEGGPRKRLKRLYSAKESEAFYLDFLPKNLDFLPKSLGFPSGKVWISFPLLTRRPLNRTRSRRTHGDQRASL